METQYSKLILVKKKKEEEVSSIPCRKECQTEKVTTFGASPRKITIVKFERKNEIGENMMKNFA